MIKRPKRGETEEDLLRMQEEFLAEKAKNPGMQPAAKFVKVAKEPKKSLFAKSREKTKTSAETTTQPTSKMIRTEPSNKLFDEIHNKIVGAAEPTSISDFVLGDIVEKRVEKPKQYQFQESSVLSAFPKVERSFRQCNKEGKSVFASTMEVDESLVSPPVSDFKSNDANEVTMLESSDKCNIAEVFGTKSVIVEDEKTAESVHKENLAFLSQMRGEEILAERKKLLDSIDPTLVALLAKRRQQKTAASANTTDPVTSKLVPRGNETSRANISVTSPMDTGDDTSSELDLPASNAAIEILQRSEAEKWIHFDVVEKDKLEWMRDISVHAANLKPGEKFEARFDWKGVLLPYSAEQQATTSAQSEIMARDERELYLHGEEPHRPGYTLQELFRLARSNVMQQRISAFGAVAGILNIYNQGFYDNVLDLPITKIFFLLRFGFDDNSPAMLEVVSKALAYLFYNETDETLLDFIYDNPGCHWQPVLQVTTTSSDSDDPTTIENLQKQMQQMQLNATLGSDAARISARIDESEEESRTTMSDFQLAETDLIDCLLRTNILQRIYFILHNVRPDNSTVSSCFKLLIRVARSGRSEAMNIVNNEELMHCLLDNFLPGLEKVDTTLTSTPFYNYPQYLCLKLIRVLMSQNLGIALKFINWNIVDKLQNYLYNREDINSKLIKIQIESLRIVRCLLLLQVDKTLYKKFLPAFRYMLEWHLAHVIYDEGGPLLIRQHAAALLAAVTSSTCNLEIATTVGEVLNDCCCSWFYKATKSGVKEFSQATLLSACLNVVTWYTRNCDAVERFRVFNEKYLCNFLVSEGFVQFVSTLKSSSIILRATNDRRNIHPALPNMGSVLLHELGPQLIVPQTYCVFLLSALWRLLELQLSLHNRRTLIDLLIQPQIIEPVVQYLNALATQTNRFLATNFFAKSELRLVYGFLCFDGFLAYLPKSQMLQICYNFLCCLTAEYIAEIESLFERIIFNPEYIAAEEEVLKQWRSKCLELVYPHYIVVPPTELTLSMASMQPPILPTDWPYFQLKVILHNYIENIKQKPAVILSEREVVHMTFTFVSLLEERNPQLVIVTPTEKLMYLMIAFMGPDSQFLESDMRSLLQKHLLRFYEQCKDVDFQFDALFEGKCKFENLYALFVDHFQAASYGDELFGSLVLVPLAQKYDNKWRRRLWSDYGAALRFLDCDENLLIGGLQAYLEPPEQEESLLKAYALALQTNLVRPDTVPFKIAQHHLKKFKERSNK